MKWVKYLWLFSAMQFAYSVFICVFVSKGWDISPNNFINGTHPLFRVIAAPLCLVAIILCLAFFRTISKAEEAQE